MGLFACKWLRAAATTEIALHTPMTGITAKVLSDEGPRTEAAGLRQPAQNCTQDWKSCVTTVEVSRNWRLAETQMTSSWRCESAVPRFGRVDPENAAADRGLAVLAHGRSWDQKR
jgi:hypothetical protein